MSERQRIVYLVLCHNSAAYVEQLLRLIYHPSDFYIIHCDRKAPTALHALIHQASDLCQNVLTIESQLCSWGGYSLINATLRGIGAALAEWPDWSHLVLLSEQHLPLRSPDAIANILKPGKSFIEGRPLGGMQAARAAEVRQRFGMIYRELPGVGSFTYAESDASEDFYRKVHQGSQWAILARAACQRIAARDSQQETVKHLQASLLPDETFLQTLLYGTSLGNGLELTSKVATYIAWPAPGTTSKMIFTDMDFVKARGDGFLFIRKRPESLTPYLNSMLQDEAGRGSDALNGVTWHDAPSQGSQLTQDDQSLALEKRVVGLLQKRFPTLGASREHSPRRPGPSFFLSLRSSGLQPECFVAVLSFDRRQFKIMLVWRPQHLPRTPEAVWLEGRLTTLIKARVARLHNSRDVFLPEMQQSGFIDVKNDAEVGSLVDSIAAYLIAGSKLRLACSDES